MLYTKGECIYCRVALTDKMKNMYSACIITYDDMIVSHHVANPVC